MPVQCILLPNDERKFLPAEWTPLYAGVPVPLADASGSRYGGGWVEPLGLNARLDTPPPAAGGTSAAAESGERSLLSKKYRCIDRYMIPGAAILTPQRCFLWPPHTQPPTYTALPGHELTVELLGPASLAEAVSISSGYVPYALALGKDKKGEVMTNGWSASFHVYVCVDSVFTLPKYVQRACSWSASFHVQWKDPPECIHPRLCLSTLLSETAKKAAGTEAQRAAFPPCLPHPN